MTATSRIDLASVLEERARALARAPQEADDVQGEELVVLRTGDDRYGLALSTVHECERPSAISPLPGVPAAWRGLVNLRGTLHPVLDLRAALGGAPTPDGDDMRVCIVEAGGIVAGLLVESVEEIVRVAEEDLAPALPASGGVDAWRGITPEMVAVLDVERLLGAPQLAVDHGAAA